MENGWIQMAILNIYDMRKFILENGEPHHKETLCFLNVAFFKGLMDNKTYWLLVKQLLSELLESGVYE